MDKPNSDGASVKERLLAAARFDNEDLLLEVFKEGNFDINCFDALGNTPLHLAVAQVSANVLDPILREEGCDVDPINRIEKATPLHLAVRLDLVEQRHYFVSNLLEAGADTSIKDKNGDTAEDLIPSGDDRLREIFREFQTQASYSRDDIASDGEDDGGSASEEA